MIKKRLVFEVYHKTRRLLAVLTKTITVYLQPGASIHKSAEVIASKKAGWQIVLIIPHGRNEKGQLMCEIQMLRKENKQNRNV